jgi:hypothetical protein
MQKPDAQERERALRNIAEVALPTSDPVYGKRGPLLERWRTADMHKSPRMAGAGKGMR